MQSLVEVALECRSWLGSRLHVGNEMCVTENHFYGGRHTIFARHLLLKRGRWIDRCIQLKHVHERLHMKESVLEQKTASFA